jgi:hypothetical protein
MQLTSVGRGEKNYSSSGRKYDHLISEKMKQIQIWYQFFSTSDIWKLELKWLVGVFTEYGHKFL